MEKKKKLRCITIQHKKPKRKFGKKFMRRIGRLGGAATLQLYGQEHYVKMSAKRATHGGGRPRKLVEDENSLVEAS